MITSAIAPFISTVYTTMRVSTPVRSSSSHPTMKNTTMRVSAIMRSSSAHPKMKTRSAAASTLQCAFLPACVLLRHRTLKSTSTMRVFSQHAFFFIAPIIALSTLLITGAPYTTMRVSALTGHACSPHVSGRGQTIPTLTFLPLGDIFLFL